MIENLTLEQHNNLLFTAIFLIGLTFGAAVSTTVYALQEARKKKIDRFRDLD